jgi:hypothetical protein
VGGCRNGPPDWAGGAEEKSTRAWCFMALAVHLQSLAFKKFRNISLK